MPDDPVVTFSGEDLVLDPLRPLSFGRGETCTLRLDPDDLGISRLAGELVGDDAGYWWLHNRSSSRALEVIDDLGFRVVLAPGRRVAMEGRSTVVVTGSVRRHALEVSVPAPTPAAAEPTDGAATDPSAVLGAETAVGTGVVVNDADRQALAALFEGYLREFPRHDPHPRTYADAAARLGWPRTTVVKRIEYLRTRLTDAGVPNLHGDNAMRALGEHVIATGLLSREDLASLPD
ncbi:hypothetical protein KSP35_00500 [Aquihabitans sp. G128]|uniref:hypothetical protein n=1 Tax=Aquihabitans sp. G128 TaxID=2849779 RepID=UPI001C228348|nr:hypothetical protein [Aquihabitans sp. G128]QXC61371.1 hypothetical protein KSP35_00500 [Aquihabitans sp. G128]